MNEDILITASCYLDGELTDTERRAAEIDPAVMAEVARMRALQQAMGEVSSPASPSEIDARINAAFAAARTATPAASDPSTDKTSNPTSEQTAVDNRRSARTAQRSRDVRFARYLGIAAAVVSLGLVGVVLTRRGDEDGSFDTAGESAATTVASAEATSAEQMSATTAALPAESMADSMMADSTMAESAPGMAEDSMAAADSGDSSSAGRDGATGAGEVVVVGPDQLRDFAEVLLSDVPAGQLPLPADDEVACEPIDTDGNPLTVIASAIYEDPDDQESTPVLIAVRVDPSTTPRRFEVSALNRFDCSIVVFTEGTLAG